MNQYLLLITQGIASRATTSAPVSSPLSSSHLAGRAGRMAGV